MKKIFLKISFLLFALIVLCSIGMLTCHYGVGLVAHAEEIGYNDTDFLDGNGTESSPFLIANKYQFDNIRNYPNSYFKLVSNIKFLDADFKSGGAFYNNGNLFNSIGTAETPFSGYIDGNGFYIDNIHLSNSRGIFTCISRATFTNLRITNAVYSATKDINLMCGIICGESTSSNFTDCSISGTVQFRANTQNYTTPISGFGVYCGKATSTNFTNCINDVNVTAETSAIAGGFVAHAINCKYTNCTNNGNISGEKTLGGFAAYDASTSTVAGCVNNGNIITTARFSAGNFADSKQGFVSGGFFGYKTGGSIRNSFNYGEVKGEFCAGGFVGYYLSGSNHAIEYCSNYGSITASEVYAYAGGIIGYFSHSASSDSTFKIQYASNHGNIKSSTGSYSNYIYTQGAGGICGYFSGLAVTSISNVYNTGSVLAYHYNRSCYAGGIIGVVPQLKMGSTDKTLLVLDCAYNIGQIGNVSLGKDSSHAILGECLSSSNSALTKMQNVYALSGCCSNNEIYTGITGGICSEEQLKCELNFNSFDFRTKWFIDPFNETYPYPQLVDVDVNNITKVTVIDENESIIETIEGIVPSFENIQLQLWDDNGNHTIIPFRPNYIFSGYNINNVSLQNIKVKYANVLSENEFKLNVILKSISSIQIQNLPSKINYYENDEEFDPSGGSVKVNYNNGSNDIIDLSRCDISGFDNSSIGTKNLTVSYQGFYCTFNVVVYNLASITVSKKPSKTDYVLGQPKNFSTGELTLNYSNGTSKTIGIDNSMCACDEDAIGIVEVTVNYAGLKTTFNVNVSEKVVNYYEIFSPAKTTYYIGEELDLTDGYIKIVYVSDDNYTVNVDLKDATITGFDSKTSGVKNVYVSYETILDSYVVIVKDIYAVSFMDYDGTILSQNTYHYGDIIVIPSNPCRSSDNKFDYLFIGWDKEVSPTCTGSVIYTAQYSEIFKEYIITFKNYDGTVLSSKTYHYGDTVAEPAEPTKPADNTYTYTFKAWDKEVASVSGNVTYTATYDAMYIEYTVVFKNYDGTILSQRNYHYDDDIIVPENPTQEANLIGTFEFVGWDKEITKCQGDKVYTATYDIVYIDYTVVFKNYDGTVLSSKTYHYGDTVEEPSTPTKPADNTYTYTFKEWDQQVTSVSGNITYTATYDATYIEYTIVFKNYDGTILSSKIYHYGDTVAEPSIPTRPADNIYTYTFKAWDKEIADCAGNETYTATYSFAEVKDSRNESLSAGAIAGIATGSAAAVGLGGFSLFWFVIKKKRFSDLFKWFKKK